MQLNFRRMRYSALILGLLSFLIPHIQGCLGSKTRTVYSGQYLWQIEQIKYYDSMTPDSVFPALYIDGDFAEWLFHIDGIDLAYEHPQNANLLITREILPYNAFMFAARNKQTGKLLTVYFIISDLYCDKLCRGNYFTRWVDNELHLYDKKKLPSICPEYMSLGDITKYYKISNRNDLPKSLLSGPYKTIFMDLEF